MEITPLWLWKYKLILAIQIFFVTLEAIYFLNYETWITFFYLALVFNWLQTLFLSVAWSNISAFKFQYPLTTRNTKRNPKSVEFSETIFKPWIFPTKTRQSRCPSALLSNITQHKSKNEFLQEAITLQIKDDLFPE